MLNIDQMVEGVGFYLTTFPTGQSFTWRLLTLKEYKVFSSLRTNNILSPLEIYIKVFERCYVGEPEVISGKTPAGIFISIGQLIMWLSGDGVGNEAEEIADARSRYPVDSVLELMKRIILLAFPYKPEELENWTRPYLIDRFVLAEAVLINSDKGYVPLDLKNVMTPAQAAAQKNKQVIDFRRENREYDKEFTNESRSHPTDLHPAELQKRLNKTDKLNAEQLRQVEYSMQAEKAHKEKMKRRR